MKMRKAECDSHTPNPLTNLWVLSPTWASPTVAQFKCPPGDTSPRPLTRSELPGC